MNDAAVSAMMANLQARTNHLEGSFEGLRREFSTLAAALEKFIGAQLIQSNDLRHAVSELRVSAERISAELERAKPRKRSRAEKQGSLVSIRAK